MLASATVLTKRVMEGTVIAEHLQQVVMLQEQIEEHYGRQDELKQFVQTKGGMAFVEATIALVDCLALVSEVASKSQQLMSMTQEHKEAATRFSVVRVALYGESVDGMADVDTSAVRRLRKQALDMQVLSLIHI